MRSSPGPSLSRRLDLPYRLVIALVRLVFLALGLRITVRGAEHLPATGPAVLASNHVGYLDFTFVGLAGRRRGRFVRFMAKQSVFEPPVVGPAMRAMGHVPVDRRPGTPGVPALRAADAWLRRGDVVGLFPEATISRSFTLKDMKPGAAFLAQRTGAPLVPVVVWGSQRVLTAGPRWMRRRGAAITVLVGEPLPVGPDESPYDVTARLGERLAQLLEEAMDGYPQAPRDAQDRWWVPAARGGSAPPRPVAAEQEQAAIARREARRAAKTSAGPRTGARPHSGLPRRRERWHSLHR
ncbi:lysophospholipid acyltransferase family protein [Lapillicoccus jejuensis]|uniref:1-acyl-sn-glycerol-3-phosphate acyltransferase n=1 Tax=Lapillicoccus jejuensis TaxID=402171 RepID=A0A542DXU4_9MICO|nr:lysophospholipid acyltransferase family protein [Lapillicoccus jejuensis]TQJ07895.1 1-acyl-sn-glycerol-3-phosphate acyltransferase [Lapillicoccus jejuensis]